MAYWFSRKPKSRIRKIAGRVRTVHDGDTVTVERENCLGFSFRRRRGRLKVRLAYIDTPELRYSEPGAQSAQQVLEKLIGGKRVFLEYEQLPSGRPRTGSFSRILAVIHLQRTFLPNLNVNHWLLRKGVAQLYDDPDNITPHHWKRFQCAERTARRQKLGIWKYRAAARRGVGIGTWIAVGVGMLIGIVIGVLLVSP